MSERAATGWWSRAWVVSAAAVVMLLVAVSVQKIWSADFWWQMKNGEWIIEHRDVPTVEMYSHTAKGTPLREMRWVYCALVFLAWKHAGAWLLVLAQAAMVAGTWAILAWPVRGAMKTPLGVLIVGLGLAAGFGRWVMRPELITYVMTAAFLVMLWRGVREPKWRGVWALPLLQVLWVNGHTTFLFGPVLCAAFAGCDFIERAWARWRARRESPPLHPDGPVLNVRLVVVSALVVAACWVNPYGHWGAMYAVQMYRETSAEHATARLIGEMRSPLAMPLAAWGWDLYAAAGLVVVAAVTMGMVWWMGRGAGAEASREHQPTPRPPPSGRGRVTLLAVLVMGAYLFVMLQRNTALAAVMCGWVALRHAAELGEILRPWVVRLREGAAAAAAHAVLALVIALTAWYVATDRYAVRKGLPREFGFGVVEWYQPRGAAEFLLEAAPQGNLFNVMRDGSYFVWRVSERMPVFIDGRTDAYGPVILEELGRASGATWGEFAVKRGINTAVIPNHGYSDVVQALLARPDWELVHLDCASLVFVKKMPEHEPLIAVRRIDPAAWRPPATEPEEAVPAWKRTYGGVGRAWYSSGMAESLLAIGAIGPAKAHLERALAQNAGLDHVRLMLAPIYLAEGREEESARLIAGLDAAPRAAADREAARLLMGLGKLKEAIAPLARALEAEPDDVPNRVVLADLYFQTGDLARARTEYERVLVSIPDSVNEWNKLATVCEQLGDGEGAVRAYETSLKNDRSQHIVWNMLGAVWAKRGDLDRAVSCFEDSLKIKPDFGAAQRNLERVREMRK